MQALAPVLITPPASLPVTVGDVKGQVREDSNDSDNLIAGMIAAAVAHLDGYSGVLGRCIMPQTWAQSFDGFPAGDTIRLPFCDVTAVTVTYRDAANAVQTLHAGDYLLGEDALGAFIRLTGDAAWPATSARIDAARVQATCALPAQMLPAVRAAILMLVAHWFQNREAVTPGQMAETPMSVSALIGAMRRIAV